MLKHLQLLLTLFVLAIGGQVKAEEATATITFGTATGSTKVDGPSVTGDDSQGNTWTITTEGTTSFTQNSGYAHIGSGNNPATSIVFSVELKGSLNIKSFSAKFGGFKGTKGNISLKVGETEVGTGTLNTNKDVTISSTSPATGNRLTVTVTNIAKGVKAYNITYSYETTTISITPNKYGTVCLPNGGTVSGAKLYSIEGKQTTDGSVKSISLTEVQKAVAGVPYIFLGQENQLKLVHEGESVTSAQSANGLVGSFENMSVTEGMYVVYNNKVVKAGTGVTITANHAYINMADVPETPASSGARMLYFDTTTGINLMESARQADQVFDLQGRKTNLNRQGLFIVNGKKVVLK
ncbi:MAG: hypothetical protein PUG76_09340 [Prevotellaceae bacterium]|nr:hypothetical protein [Prevotellaceae bacterium]